MRIVEKVEKLLDSFVRDNFTGPFVPISDDYNKDAAIKALTIDGECPYHLVANPKSLIDALEILDQGVESDCLEGQLLKLKAKFLHQRVLENWSGTLSTELLAICDQIETIINVQKGKNEVTEETIASFYLRKGLILHFYQREKQALNCLEKAQEISGLKWSLTGVLGKRTKFQQTQVSQLILVAESSKRKKENMSTTSLPQEIDLNSDVLLDKVKLSEDAEPQSNGPINPFDACLLLAFGLNERASNPDDEMTAQQISAYVTKVLEKHSGWNVHTMALIMRSRLEVKKSKTVERAVLQYQALVDQFYNDADDAASGEDRLYLFDVIALPAIWELKVELGKSLMSLGVLRSAQEIFESLEMWNLVLDCMNLLGRRNDAEALVLRLLEKQPDEPKLLCYLADVRKDPLLYEKAWELSGHRNARSMRSLGHFYFERAKYREAMECLGKALKINTMFDSSWFTLGCAAMFCKEWDIAETAFRNVIYIKPEDGQAWSNLASVHLRRDSIANDKNSCSGRENEINEDFQERLVNAHRCLKEGIKANPESWRIWDNYLSISLQLNLFSECFVALHRLLDIRKAVDYECLKSILERISSHSTEIISTRNVISFLERAGNVLSEDPQIWDCFAFFLGNSPNQTPHDNHPNDDSKRYLECRKKQYRCLLSKSRFDVIEKDFEKVAICILQMHKACDLLKIPEEKAEEQRQLKMLLRNVTKRTRESFEDNELFVKLEAALSDLA